MIVIVVVLTLGSHGVVNHVDRRYLTFCHHHGPPSFKEDRKVGEAHLRLLQPSVPPHESDPLQHLGMRREGEKWDTKIPNQSHLPTLSLISYSIPRFVLLNSTPSHSFYSQFIQPSSFTSISLHLHTISLGTEEDRLHEVALIVGGGDGKKSGTYGPPDLQ